MSAADCVHLLLAPQHAPGVPSALLAILALNYYAIHDVLPGAFVVLLLRHHTISGQTVYIPAAPTPMHEYIPCMALGGGVEAPTTPPALSQL